MSGYWLRLLLLVVFAFAATAQDLGREFGLPLLVHVPISPIPVRADGKYIFIYELHLVTDNKKVELLKIEVWGRTRLAVIEGKNLVTSIRHSSGDGRQTSTLAAGNHAVVWIFLVAEEPPHSIYHRITGKVGDDPEPLTLNAGRTAVEGKTVHLDPPLRGERWVAFNGPSNEGHHRRGWFALGDRATVPQRFAIDFVQAYPDGQLFHGDSKSNRSYACYGAEILAVADARVVEVKDGIPENTAGEKNRPYKMTLENLTGNSVVLDLGQGRYALYGHFQPGVRVRAGDHVRAGQVLGLLGNSGESTFPHLHFGVMDGPTLLTGDGLPYVFDFYHEGSLHRGEIPLEDWAVTFPK